MKTPSPIAILAISFSLAPATLAQNQPASPESRRQVIVRVAPMYPEAARRIRLGGTVKAIAQVGPDGKVKKVDAVGGSHFWCRPPRPRFRIGNTPRAGRPKRS